MLSHGISGRSWSGARLTMHYLSLSFPLLILWYPIFCPPWSPGRRDPPGSYLRILRLQAGFLSPLHSCLTPWSPRSFSCRSSSASLDLVLNTEARSSQQLDVRPQLTSLHGRCSPSDSPGITALGNCAMVSLCEPWHAVLAVLSSLRALSSLGG